MRKKIYSIVLCIMTVALCAVLFAACKTTEPVLEAEYDYSHDIYEGETLESIRQYLKVTYTDMLGEPRVLNRDEYTLRGFIHPGTCTLTVRFADLETTVTITVKSQQHTYTVTLNYNGATGDMTMQSFSVTTGEPIGTLPTPTREGYEFVGWYVGECRVYADTLWDWDNVDSIEAHWTPENGTPDEVLVLLSAESTVLYAGDNTRLYIVTDPMGYEADVVIDILHGNDIGYVDDDVFYAQRTGECVLQARLLYEGVTYTSDELIVTVEQGLSEKVNITLKADRYLIEYSENTFVTATVTPSEYASSVTFRITSGTDVAALVGNSPLQRSILPQDEGMVTVVASVGSTNSNPVSIQVIRYDPYSNIGASGFYDRYTPATDLEDSYWRTKHHLMSGDISDQYQAPTIESDRPMSGNSYLRNIDENFFDNGNTYKVVDRQGNVVNTLYKFGAYVTLEEVAAYVYAWGDAPANYSTDKSGDPTSDAWGKYLRLNNSYYSGDTSKYPYEPVMPEIYGIDGDKQYYEMDIGTTGTDCDPAYTIGPYNDGRSILRGAARIVYARYDGDDQLLTPSERYVFYTYNHYNDFREYLNYNGGWGEMFGNITGGGRISDKYYCNPTPYIPTAKGSFGCR